jgi:RNA polymerase sigma factor (sigma-70 family)
VDTPAQPALPGDSAELAYAAALARGEGWAVRVFEVRYRSLVGHALGVALRRWRPEAPVHAEDYVQDFVGFLHLDTGARLRSYQGRSPFGAWLYTVALRYFQRRLSRLAGDRRGEAAVVHLTDGEANGAEAQLAAAQEAERLRTVVQGLSAEERLLVRLFYVEDLNAAEVARTLGKGPSAVRMKKMRLLARLRGLLGLPPDEDLPATDDERDARQVGGEP